MLSAGVQHAKLWTVDNLHGYIGSANMDWRSLTQVFEEHQNIVCLNLLGNLFPGDLLTLQVKEMGVLLRFCRTLAADLAKIIGALDYVARSDVVFPISWGPEYTTIHNRSNPMRLMINGIPAKVYFSVS